MHKGPPGEYRLRVCPESFKPELSKSLPSKAAILEERQTIRCIEHDGHRKLITPYIGDQLLICDAFGFEIPEACRPPNPQVEII